MGWVRAAPAAPALLRKLAEKGDGAQEPPGTRSRGHTAHGQNRQSHQSGERGGKHIQPKQVSDATARIRHDGRLPAACTRSPVTPARRPAGREEPGAEGETDSIALLRRSLRKRCQQG